MRRVGSHALSSLPRYVGAEDGHDCQLYELREDPWVATGDAGTAPPYG